MTQVQQRDARWEAVLRRDSRFDGRFVFAVRSTGIYCRPSCPARRSRPANVAFFEAPAAAEQAGFRACRRCRPLEAGTGALHAGAVQRLCRHIETNLDRPLRLAELAKVVGMGPHHLQRTFKRIMGITPRQYAAAKRLGVVKASLKEGRPVTEAIYEAGYGSSSRLYERAAKRLGMTPGTYQRGGRGMRIAYTVTPSPLGFLLVAATERGLSAVYLGDSEAELEAALRNEYPAAEVQRDDQAHRRWVAAVLELLRSPDSGQELPLDIRVTAFQWRVFEELQAIPPGETRSYGEMARRLGRPGAARAVGRACATNPVAVVVPCHRAVGAKGSLTGYRWGVDRKQALLAAESGGHEETPAARPHRSR